MAGLGIGGGGLLVIYLVMTGTPQTEAQGINLIYFLFSSGAAMMIHIMRRKLNFKLIFFFATLGTIGALLGSLLVQNAEPVLIQKIFGIFLLISGFLSLVKK